MAVGDIITPPKVHNIIRARIAGVLGVGCRRRRLRTRCY